MAKKKKARTNADIKLSGLKSTNKQEYKANEYPEIKIKALKTFTSTKYIVLNNSNGVEVGRIEMAPNDLVNLSIKIVPLVFSTDAITKAKDLYNTVVTTNKLGDYLNNKSLNQLSIKANILPFVDSMVVDTEIADLNINFYDSTNAHFHDPNYNTLNEHFIDKIQDIYLNKPQNKGYKGAVVFITDKGYNNPSAGGNKQGFSKTDPLRYQSIMIFDKGLNANDVFAHELAHMLGVEHSFFENEDNRQIGDNTGFGNNTKNIVDAKTYWNKEITTMEKDRADELEKLKNLEAIKNPTNRNKTEIKRIKENLKTGENVIPGYEDKMRLIDMFKESEFKVSQQKTLNFMDYDIVRTYFSKHQASIAKQECKDFYQ